MVEYVQRKPNPELEKYSRRVNTKQIEGPKQHKRIPINVVLESNKQKEGQK